MLFASNYRHSDRIFRGFIMLALLGAISACGLPRSGPSKSEILAGSVEREGDAFIIKVNDDVNRATAIVPAFSFSQGLTDTSLLDPDIVRSGDSLSLKVWENVDTALLGTTNGPSTLTDVTVDDDGYIFVPYAGNIRVEGNTIEEIRRLITEKLSEQTPDPQVEVVRDAGDGATVEVRGMVASEGVYPIERSNRTLNAMLASAGGLSIEPETALVKVLRGNSLESIWYSDLLRFRENEVNLRPDDRIIVESDTRSFTALGATGSQSQIPFEGRTITALEAIASVGGLQSSLADPTGVFVFRNEPQEIAEAVTGIDGLSGTQRAVYVLDLTDTNAIFVARDFAIRDGDTVYVTEAPFVTWNKIIAALTGSLSSVNSLSSTVSGN